MTHRWKSIAHPTYHEEGNQLKRTYGEGAQLVSATSSRQICFPYNSVWSSPVRATLPSAILKSVQHGHTWITRFNTVHTVRHDPTRFAPVWSSSARSGLVRSGLVRSGQSGASLIDFNSFSTRFVPFWYGLVQSCLAQSEQRSLERF